MPQPSADVQSLRSAALAPEGGPVRRLADAAARGDRQVAAAALGLLLCAAWGVATLGGATDIIPRAASLTDWLLPAGPLVAGVLVLLARPHSPTWLKVAFAFTLTIAAAVESIDLVGDSQLKGAAPGLIAIAAACALRWPVATVVGVFALSGTFGSLEALTPVPTGPLADGLLAAGWLALAWGWLTGRREQPRWLPLPLVLLAAYLAVTALFVLFADPLKPALYSFRASAWLMAAVLLVAFFLSEERQHELAHKAVLGVGALVGGYALLRWAIGPAGREEQMARVGGPYVLGDNNEVRLFGSLGSPAALGTWCATMIPFALASALAPIGGRWRLLALVVTGICGAALAESDARGAMVGAAAGGIAVLTLFAAGRGFQGRRAWPLALGIILALLGGGVFASTKLADEGSSGARFRGLLDPLRDASVQDRFVKWKTVLADIDELPFGHGLGASGAAEIKYARFTSPATFDPDSSYVKVAYDQGVMVMLLFIAALIALVIGLGQRAIRAPDPRSGAVAVGACGALVSFSAAMGAALSFEGLLAAAPWVLVGLGMAPYVRDVALRASGGAGG